MPLPSLHPLPANPTTGQLPLASLGGRSVGGPPPSSAAGGGGVNREVLKGLQDVAWSDDEDEPDCLLCAEPLDLSDLSFKPCQCGMQICQFCYNKLLQTDARCPGCRRAYDAKAVVFQPVDLEEVKRAKEKKTRRAKTIKQLNSMGRRHLLGVRIVMKNMVNVVGMKLPAPGDEAIPILRSNDYFGQYGKISKLYLRDRTGLSSTSVPTLTPENPATSTGIYIVYVRREDAARAILALDGIPAPQGPAGQVLHATYGTTRYCDAFLRGAKCDNTACQNLHEWGGESDCFTKEDMETALTRPAEYDARQKQTQMQPITLTTKSTWPKPSVEDPIGTALPNSASWAKSIVAGRVPVARPVAAATVARPPAKINNLVPLNASANNAAFPLPTPSPIIPTPTKEKKEKKLGAIGMSRGRSTDSSQSNNTSSKPSSPKKAAPAALPAVAPANSALSAPTSLPPPPPGLPLPGTQDAASTSQHRNSIGAEVDDLPDESISADSEAGPSSASPAPQTPGVLSEHATNPLPPPPLTSDPIYVHSPYEEPRIFAFPTSDPAFAFELDLDPSGQASSSSYRPKPFSKTLVGLAEIGVLAPDLPELLPSPNGMTGFSGSFQPFDLEISSDLLADETSDAGPSGTSAEDEGPRTTSRFDFARSTSVSRNSSPFALRISSGSGGGGQDDWLARQQPPLQQQQQQHQHQHQQAPPQQPQFGAEGGFGGGMMGIGGGDAGWQHDARGAGGADGSPYMTTGSPYARTSGYGGKGRGDRDEYDTPSYPYSTPSLQSHPNRLFSPELQTSHLSMHDEQLAPQHHQFQSPLGYGGMGQAGQRNPQPQQQQQHGFGGGGWGRTGSPSPLGAQGFRRW